MKNNRIQPLRRATSRPWGAMYGLGFFLGAAATLGTGFLADVVAPRTGFLFLSIIMLLCFSLISKAGEKF